MPEFGFFAFDGLALLFALACAVALFFAAWGAVGVARLMDYHLLTLLLFLLILATVGATNTPLFYIFWEVMAFASWGLGRWASTGHRQSMMGPLPLQGFGALGSLGLCLAILLLALDTRSLDIRALTTADVTTVALLLLGGIILKSFALLSPAWYPSRDERSFFVAHAMLASAGLFGIGLYPYLRFLSENAALPPQWRAIALVVGLAIALLLALAAIGERDLHKLVAYAAFSQFGFLLAFFAIVKPGDLSLILLTVLAAALAIVGFTLCLGAAASAAEERDLRRLQGAGHHLRLTAVVFLLCSFALAGLPPLGGYTARLIGGIALIDRGENVLAYACFAVAVLTLLYTLRLFRIVFHSTPVPGGAPSISTALPAQAVAAAAALALLGVGLLPDATLDFLSPAIALVVK